MEGLKEKLDEIFSKLIRLTYADWKGDVHCFTCNWIGNWKESDCGHFITRGCLILRYENDNARPQCRDCNRQRDGRQDVFEEELRWDLGDERVDELLNIVRHREAHYDEMWYRERIMHMGVIVKGLESGHTIGA